jgi:hypothetical protein
MDELLNRKPSSRRFARAPQIWQINSCCLQMTLGRLSHFGHINSRPMHGIPDDFEHVLLPASAVIAKPSNDIFDQRPQF